MYHSSPSLLVVALRCQLVKDVRVPLDTVETLLTPIAAGSLMHEVTSSSILTLLIPDITDALLADLVTTIPVSLIHPFRQWNAGAGAKSTSSKEDPAIRFLAEEQSQCCIFKSTPKSLRREAQLMWYDCALDLLWLMLLASAPAGYRMMVEKPAGSVPDFLSPDQ